MNQILIVAGKINTVKEAHCKLETQFPQLQNGTFKRSRTMHRDVLKMGPKITRPLIRSIK